MSKSCKSKNLFFIYLSCRACYGDSKYVYKNIKICYAPLESAWWDESKNVIISDIQNFEKLT